MQLSEAAHLSRDSRSSTQAAPTSSDSLSQRPDIQWNLWPVELASSSRRSTSSSILARFFSDEKANLIAVAVVRIQGCGYFVGGKLAGFVELLFLGYGFLVSEVKFSEHKWIRRKEICTCSFVVLWQHGPMAGEKTTIGIESICLLRPQDLIRQPVLDDFLHMAKKKFKTENSTSGQTDDKIKLRKRGRDFSNIGVACSSEKLSSENDDNQSKKPAPSPSPIETETLEPVWTYSHAIMQPTNSMMCSFCARTYPCSTKLNCHLACIGGNTEPCPSVPIYWQVFYTRYLRILATMSGQKPRDIVAAEILKKLDAEVAAGHISCPADRVTVKEGTTYRDQTKEDAEVMSEHNWWQQKLRKVLQRCFKQYDIPGCIVADPDFIAACHQIAAAAKAGHDNILPSQEDMDIWIFQESGDVIY